MWVQSEREVEPRKPCSVLLAAVAIPKAAKLISRFMTVPLKAQPRYDPAVSAGCRPSSNWYRLYLEGPRRGLVAYRLRKNSNVLELLLAPPPDTESLI